MSKKLEKKMNDAITINGVQNIIDYIEQNLLEDLIPNDIAKQFYLSISTLNNLFRVVCGMPIMEYVRNRRLSLAGKELLSSSIHIIDIAFKYGYETPEAFTKAFTRFHGFPPSFVRRAYPETKLFSPLQIKIEVQGGWENSLTDNPLSLQTKPNSLEQEQNLFYCYDETTKFKGGINMENIKYHISVKDMQYKNDWKVLLLLAKKLDQQNIKFKVDGNTMVFAHGLEFKLEKICLTFKWNEEPIITDYFNYDGKAKSTFTGFKYFDATFEGMKIRCMFYGEDPANNSDAWLFRNAEPVEVDGQIIYVQTLEFYYENEEPNDEHYQRVEQFLKRQ
jgi:AraC-like DNA-binding protein